MAAFFMLISSFAFIIVQLLFTGGHGANENYFEMERRIQVLIEDPDDAGFVSHGYSVVFFIDGTRVNYPAVLEYRPDAPQQKWKAEITRRLRPLGTGYDNEIFEKFWHNLIAMDARSGGYKANDYLRKVYGEDPAQMRTFFDTRLRVYTQDISKPKYTVNVYDLYSLSAALLQRRYNRKMECSKPLIEVNKTENIVTIKFVLSRGNLETGCDRGPR